VKSVLLDTGVVIRCINILSSKDGLNSGISLCFTSSEAGFDRAASAAVKFALMCGTSLGIDVGRWSHGIGVDGPRTC
jgi:hypothetical protein